MLTPEQLAIRKTGIGASEIAAVVGESPWESPLDVWARKVGLVEPEEETMATLLGHRLEEVVAELYAERHGGKITKGHTMRHPKISFALATPDRIVHRDADRHLLEIKTVGQRQAYRWGPEGTLEIPIEYLLQTQWQMLVDGARKVHLAALLLGDRDLRVYEIPFVPQLAVELVESGRIFWEEYVLAGVEPPVDGCTKAVEYFRRRYPEARGPMLRAETPEVLGALEMLRVARAQAKAAAAAEEEAKARVQAIIGEAAGIEWDGGIVTWKNNRPSEVTDWKAVAMAAGASDDMIKKNTIKKPGPRVFRTSFREE